jgi:hypothetical protein
MSAHGHTDNPAPSPMPAPAHRSSTPKKIAKGVAAAVAVVAVGFGANAISGGTSSTAATSAATPQAQAQAPAGTAAVPGATPPAGAPRGARPPGFGTPVTGSTLSRLTAVATAKYPGTVEQAMKLADGSYVVHVLTEGGTGEVHVLVSKALKITGTQTRGPGGPPSGAAGQAPPQGQAPASAASGGATQS